MLNNDISNEPQPSVAIDHALCCAGPGVWWKKLVFRFLYGLGFYAASMRYHRVPLRVRGHLLMLSERGWYVRIVGVGWREEALRALYSNDWVGDFVGVDSFQEACVVAAVFKCETFYTNQDTTGLGGLSKTVTSWDDILFDLKNLRK